MISFRPDGTAAMLHDESFFLPQDLGHITSAPRVSWIDFNEHSQQWEVRLDPHADSPVFSHPSRAACLAWEIRHFQSLMCNPA